ncbi:glycosyltransferase [Palleronia sp. KMU-117]|uniref:glycosyltransferase n=1 Tax=Palleronia sp. KMU-117 TaxID=3434108 RepID=UPI003D72256E
MFELFRRASAVYRRYRRHRLEIRTGPVPLTGPAPGVAGYVERIVFSPTGTAVTGWTRGQRISLASGGATLVLAPAELRSDVPETSDGPGRGFVARLQSGIAPLDIEATGQGWAGRTQVSAPGIVARLRAEARVALSFAALLLRNLPALRAYLIGGDEASGNALRAMTGLFGGGHVRRIQPGLIGDGAVSRDQHDGVPVVVVLPVHGKPAMVEALLARLVDEPSRTDLHILVIDDASPEPEMRPMLRDWRDRRPERFDLIEAAENAGFVASANLGLARAEDRGAHVVLLNSDTLPPPGWLDRLLAPIRSDAGVASVTPFSNDAEILSVPRAGYRCEITAGVGDLIDHVAKRFDPARSMIEVPVGIGFCMAMNRRFLDQLPRFDTVFDRGYGEEVDWCRRASALGGRHIGLASLFVHHIGGASFGSAEKAARVARSNAVIRRRHPVHDASVAHFLEDDPAFGHRFALALAQAGAETDVAVPVILAHSLGGGAESWLHNVIRDRTGAGASTVVARVGSALRWRIELHRPEASLVAAVDDDATAISVLSSLRQRRIVYSCGVGAVDPRALVGLMSALSKGPGQSAEVLFHDFYPLGPNYTLLGASGVFEGVPDAACETPQHQWSGIPGQSDPMSLAEWRGLWGPFLGGAARIRAFSQDSAGHVVAAYPFLSGRIEVSPHRMGATPAAARPPQNGERVIGVLGDLNRAKGAEVLQELSRWLSRDRRRPGLAHVGSLDPAYRLARGHVSHGAYRLDEIDGLVQRYRIGCWFMPSVWPETFSFTTHEMLATGLPVICFPLGAQAEAVARAPNGVVLPRLDTDPGRIGAEIIRIMGW